MKTLFKSQDLWDYVEIGFESSNEDEARTNERHKKDAKALFYVQQAVDESIFLRIAYATTTKQAWMILSSEYQDSSKVIIVKLQSLRLEFETSSMKSNEPVKDFLARVSTVVKKWHFRPRESVIIQVNVEEKESKYAQEEDKEDNFLFMTISTQKQEKNDLRYVDNSCTHHMTGDQTKFKGLHEGFKSHVRVGDNKQLRIEDQGRLMETGHSLLFDDEKCVVKHKATGKIIASTYMTLNCIQRLLTTPYSPEQNGVAERKNRTVVRITRMLKQKGERRKLDGKSQKHVFIGYCTQSKAYKLYEPISKKIVISRNVVFDEHASWNWDEKVVSVNAQDEVFTTIENKKMPAPTSTSTSPVQSSPYTPTSSATRSLVSSPTSSDNNTKTGQMESMRLRRKEALESEEWKMAMKDELAAIQRNNALELVDLPADKAGEQKEWKQCSGLVPNPPPLTLFVPPSRTDWDILFQPLFDELLNPPPSIDPPAPEVIALNVAVVALTPVESIGLPSSTTIDQDAPSPSNSQTSPETQSPIISIIVEEENHDLDIFTKTQRHLLIIYKYALESLKKYGIESSDPVDTPMVEKSKLDEDPQGKAIDP
ncbi:uncharacterized mitochondrial protein-like protein [Tanacetum coccineum]